MSENKEPEIVDALNKLTGAINVLNDILADIKDVQSQQAEYLKSIGGRLNALDLRIDPDNKG